MGPDRPLLAGPPRVVSVGLPLFAAELERLGVAVAHLDWRPPAGADARLAAALGRLQERSQLIERANAETFERLVNGEPVLVDCRPAWEALGLPPRTILHAGPPIPWARMCEPMRAAVLCAIRYEGWAANDDAAAFDREMIRIAARGEAVDRDPRHPLQGFRDRAIRERTDVLRRDGVHDDVRKLLDVL